MQLGCKLLITPKNIVDRLFRQLLGEEAHEPYNGESAHHSDSTAVDGIDGVASQHIDDGETHPPDEAGPDGSRRDILGIETQHERCEESTSQSTPGNTHELGDKCRWIEGDEQ